MRRCSPTAPTATDVVAPARRRRRRAVAAAAVLAGLLAGCGLGDDEAGTASAPPPPALAAREHGRPEVVARYDHDAGSFTQGLVLSEGQVLHESAGLYGQSDVRRTELSTGEVLERAPLPDDLFAEGLARVDDRLVQLTWREGVARVYDADDLRLVDEHTYDGEGWGLCYDGDRLVMSDGTDRLVFRDPDRFDVLGEVRVTVADDQPVPRLNELECVDGRVWANVWPTDLLVEIDPGTGEVTNSVDASGLRAELDDDGADVLNGIAYDGETDTFLLTGKRWPALFRVRLPSAGVAADQAEREP